MYKIHQILCEYNVHCKKKSPVLYLKTWLLTYNDTIVKFGTDLLVGQLQNFWNEAEKKGTTLIGEYIPNMGIYVLICIFIYFLTDGELDDIHVSSYQSAGQSPQISAEDHGRKVKRLYMDCTVLETAEKRKTTVLYSSTAYNWWMTISNQLNITMITKCFTKL